MATALSESTHTQHLIATNRSLDTLLAWSAEFAHEQATAGRRIIYAPCHTLRGAVSLRSWILSNARHALGDSAPADAPTLLSGAADTLIIADPASADQASLHWLADLLSCADAAQSTTATPPMPQLVVLVPGNSGDDPRVSELLTRLNMLGSTEERISGRPADPNSQVIEAEIGGLRDRYGKLLAALALMPCPLALPSANQLAQDTGAGSGAVTALSGGVLFRVVGNDLMPTNADVISKLRAAFSPEELRDGANALLAVIEKDLADIPDARVELLLQAGDERRAVKLARKHFDEYVADERYEEALRILRSALALRIPLESGRHAEFIDQAKLAAMLAEVGQYKEAQRLVDELARRRDLFGTGDFIEWLGLAARRLAMNGHFDPRQADSLMRRAIRLKGTDTDNWVRLRLLRVQLLRSRAFGIDDRADWLLSHVNQKMLDKVSERTLAAYLDEMAERMFANGDFKGAFKRLRRLGGLHTTDERMGRAMLLMARCRRHYRDHEAAHRYGVSAVHYGLRSAQLATVKGAVAFLNDLERDRPRAVATPTPPARAKGQRPRLTAAVDIPTPTSANAVQLFEILQSRFNVARWVRRRGTSTEVYGTKTDDVTDSMSVYQEADDGNAARVATCGEPDELRGIMLTRRDGSDLVVYNQPAEQASREDAIVQFLLTDREAAPVEAGGSAPARKTVVDEYVRRAHDLGITRGLHHTMETLFNKDVLIFFEEQGFSKEEMADKLGVSRATLYRMYARAGLN